MIDNDFLSIIAIILTITLGSGSIITLYYQNRMIAIRNREEKIREERRKLYEEFIDPFVRIFANSKEPNEAMQYIQSLDYKRITFEVTLLGSDGVVQAHGNLMQFFYKYSKTDQIDSVNALALFGKLLLEIRRDLGSKTSLSGYDLLKFFITDIEKHKDKFS